MSEQTCTINDLDGNAFHTVESGPLAEVMARSDERQRRQIETAVANGGECTESFERDGEEYTVRVVVR
jgi:hypothetical protein